MSNYIDIGINLSNKQFNNDYKSFIEKAIDKGVSQMILTGTNLKNSNTHAIIAQHYKNVLYSTAGIHPHDAKYFDDDTIHQLKALLHKPQVVAVGECGLDFDRDFSPRILQEICFKAQLELAIEIGKPLFLHERAAFTRFNEIMSDYKSNLPNAVIHCFTGSLIEAKSYLESGFYLGFTGAISDKNRFAHLEAVLAYTPLDRMMIETDAPFMLPKNIDKSELDPLYKRRNEPAFLPYVAKTIAEIKNVTIETIAQHTTQNAKLFFNLVNT